MADRTLLVPEQAAEEIYSRLPRYAALIGECIGRLEERMRQGA